MANILVNSKTLMQTIRDAQGANVKNFKIKGDEIIFSDKILLRIVRIGRYNIDTEYKALFDTKYFEKVANFLSLLEEQPISVEFVEYMHTKIQESPHIELTQLTKRFI